MPSNTVRRFTATAANRLSDMHLVYIDDSKADGLVVFSALIIPVQVWDDALAHLVGMRRQMRDSDGVFTTYELHATDWLRGSGNVGKRPVPKGARARLFEYALSAIAMIPRLKIITACCVAAREQRLFERLIERIDVNMRKCGSLALIISDEGKNYDGLLRKMRRHNFITSRYGAWEDGSTAKNLPVERIIEDLTYRDSARSYFIQAADFVAYALLRHERPTLSIMKRGLADAFLIVERVLVKQAYGRDPKRLGIIRSD